MVDTRVGPDLLTGTWLPDGPCTLTVEGGILRVTLNSIATGMAYQAIPTVIGKPYLFAGTVAGGTAVSKLFRLGTTLGGSQYHNAATGVAFTAATETTYVQCLCAPWAGSYGEFTDLSLYETIPFTKADPPATISIDDTAAPASATLTGATVPSLPVTRSPIFDPAIFDPEIFGGWVEDWQAATSDPAEATFDKHEAPAAVTL